MQPNYESCFLDLLSNLLPSVHLYVDQVAAKRKRAKHTRWIWITGPNQTKTYKRPFCEDDAQWVAENVLAVRPTSCPELIIDKRFGDKSPDYRFATPDSPTFEVKGPVRRTFFNPEKFGGNWTKATGKGVRNDVRKILLHHCRNFGEVPHYLALLLPCPKDAVPPTFHTVMQ